MHGLSPPGAADRRPLPLVRDPARRRDAPRSGAARGCAGAAGPAAGDRPCPGVGSRSGRSKCLACACGDRCRRRRRNAPGCGVKLWDVRRRPAALRARRADERDAHRAGRLPAGGGRTRRSGGGGHDGVGPGGDQPHRRAAVGSPRAPARSAEPQAEAALGLVAQAPGGVRGRGRGALRAQGPSFVGDGPARHRGGRDGPVARRRPRPRVAARRGRGALGRGGARPPGPAAGGAGRQGHARRGRVRDGPHPPGRRAPLAGPARPAPRARAARRAPGDGRGVPPRRLAAVHPGRARGPGRDRRSGAWWPLPP